MERHFQSVDWPKFERDPNSKLKTQPRVSFAKDDLESKVESNRSREITNQRWHRRGKSAGERRWTLKTTLEKSKASDKR